ncbi:hypothetical protein BDP81DRAFT_82514 [Colletotrichum phormii]|uniref:Uncharacterized protein n=1 Tax=Colletotrichum phormii TaxID=359342 RepID=A0AAJ0EIP6_9PEZI|nr:uncharacterized protein BDP81DRAFT_82514 [Colletotrichum phormii]KAK1654390.1 hypothetical protein BDP81DRAFT_82514 [Colletotrichum phormii]
MLVQRIVITPSRCTCVSLHNGRFLWIFKLQLPEGPDPNLPVEVRHNWLHRRSVVDATERPEVANYGLQYPIGCRKELQLGQGGPGSQSTLSHTPLERIRTTNCVTTLAPRQAIPFRLRVARHGKTTWKCSPRFLKLPVSTTRQRQGFMLLFAMVR